MRGGTRETVVEQRKCWLVKNPPGRIMTTTCFLSEGEKAYYVGDPSVGIPGADVIVLDVYQQAPGMPVYVEIQFEDGTTDEVPISMIKSHEDMLYERIMDLENGMQYWEDRYKKCEAELERCRRMVK